MTNVSVPLEPSKEETTRRLVALDVLRGLAAIAVVLFHYTYEYNKRYGHSAGIPLFHDGQFGVDLFFVISGFVIFMTIERTTWWFDFVVSRFSRLFPVYWAAVILTFVLVSVSGLPHYDIGYKDALVNLSMLEAFFFVPYVDGVYWTLSLELSFYAIVLVLYKTKLLSRINIIGVAWLILLILFHIASHHYGIELPSRVEIILISQYAHLFLAGLMVYKLSREGVSITRVLILGACVATEGYFYGLEAGFLALVFVSGVLAAAKGWLDWLTWKPLVFLGTISYSLYLIHQNIGYVLLRGSYALGLNPYLGITITIAAVIGMATMLTFVIEKPGMRIIRQWYKRQGRDWLIRPTGLLALIRSKRKQP